MPRRGHPCRAGGSYHVYNRGNNRQPVFWSDLGYRAFLQAFRPYFDIPLAHAAGSPGALLAYCLMPNHYPSVLQPEDDALSARMKRMLISFTKALNAKNQRVGALFQGQVHAVAVETDEQLIHLTAYVHCNPVQAGLVRRP
jgi:putative transposase